MGVVISLFVFPLICLMEQIILLVCNDLEIGEDKHDEKINNEFRIDRYEKKKKYGGCSKKPTKHKYSNNVYKWKSVQQQWSRFVDRYCFHGKTCARVSKGKGHLKKLENKSLINWSQLVDVTNPNYIDMVHSEITVYPLLRTPISGNSCGETDNSMRYEWTRFRSFKTYPNSSSVNYIRLSQCGFYYTGVGNGVKCYCCGCKYNTWKSGDDPSAIHKMLAPHCQFINGQGYDNVAISADCPDTMSHVERSMQSQYNDTDRASSRISSIYTVTRQSPSVNSGISTPSMSHVERSMQYNDTDRASSQISSICTVTRPSPSVNSGILTPSPGDNTSSMRCLGVVVDRPKYPNYAVLSVRISSYCGWPEHLPQTPQQLASAGLFYAGFLDSVRCFFCGGGLKNWEANDDPWVEHAQWFPECAFVSQSRGDTFVEDVLHCRSQNLSEVNVCTPQSTKNDGRGATGKYKDFFATPAASSVMEMGYTHEMIETALRTLNKKNGDSSDNICAEDILNVLFEMEDSKSMMENNNTDNKGNYASNDAVSVKEREIDNRHVVNSLQGLSLDETSTLLEENARLKKETLCKLCLQMEATITLLPCGHLVCCDECKILCTVCPVCQGRIKGTIKTFRVPPYLSFSCSHQLRLVIISTTALFSCEEVNNLHA